MRVKILGRVKHRQSPINYHHRGAETRVLSFQKPTEFLRRGFNRNHQTNVRISDKSSIHTYPTGQTLNLGMTGSIMTQGDNEFCVLCNGNAE